MSDSTHAIASVFNGLQAAWLQGMRDVLAHGRRIEGVIDPTSIGSGFGKGPRPCLEILGHRLVISDPRRRLLKSPARALNEGYCFANVIWFLTGDPDTTLISRYNPRARCFTEGLGYSSSFLGDRFFGELKGRPAVDWLLQHLRSDPATRRAALSLHDGEDLVAGRRDVSCWQSVGYLLRDGRLHCFVTMRSQSAAMLLPYDVFLFSCVQEMLATELGVGLGDYVHSSVSFHIYEDELDRVNAILTSPHEGEREPTPPMTIRPIRERRRIVAAERSLRLEDPRAAGEPRDELDGFWRFAIKTLKSHIAANPACTPRPCPHGD